MENTGFSLVTLVLLLPLVGFFLILFFQREEQAETHQVDGFDYEPRHLCRVAAAVGGL